MYHTDRIPFRQISPPTREHDNNASTNMESMLTHSRRTMREDTLSVPDIDSCAGDKNGNFRHLVNCHTVKDTPFVKHIELSSDHLQSHIISVSEQTYGAAANLIKATDPQITMAINEESFNVSGWLVKRHEPQASVIIRFGRPGTIHGIDIDITGYSQCAPINASVKGLLENQAEWLDIIPIANIKDNSHNFFEIINDKNIYSHIQLVTYPGGGVSRFRVYGDIIVKDFPTDKEVNLASVFLGAKVTHRPFDIICGDAPNIINDRSESWDDGWICPRRPTETLDDYTTIQLCHQGIISRFVVDTTHFIGNSPKSISIEGSHGNTGKESWVNLIESEYEHHILPNMVHTIPCVYHKPLEYIRIRPIPNGGIQQLKAYGMVSFEQEETPVSLKRKHTKCNDAVAQRHLSRKSSRAKKPVSRYSPST